MMKTMTTKDLLVFAVLVIIQPFVSLAQMPVIQRISVPNSETINAMAIDPDRQVWYLLAKKQDALSLVSVSINGSINWFYNSIITNYADDKNINPIINQPLAKPQLAVDPISGDVLVSGWTSTGPIYGFNFGAVTVTETEGFGWNGICWSPKLALFVVVGQNQSDQDHGAILVSADGILWTELKGSEFVGLASVTWSPALEIFVAVGTSTNGITFVYTSRDGYEWVRVKSVNTLKFKVSSVRWSPIDGGCFFAAGYSTSSYDMAIIMRSCGSAIDWTSNMIMLRNDFIDIPMAISPELKVVILMSMESNGTLALSFDNARTWEFVDNLMPLMQPFGIAWSPTVRRFVAIGTLLNPVTGQQMNGRIITSSYNSYLNWTFTHNVTFEYLQYGKIAWYDDLGMFIVSGTVSLGEGVIFTSQDGLSWTKHSVIFSYWYIFAYSSLLSTMLFLDQSSIVFTVPFYYQAAGVLTRFDAHGKMKWYNQYGNDSSIIPNGLAISQSESVSVVGTQFITNGQLFGPLFSRFNFTDGNEISNFEFDLSISMNEMLQNTLNRLFEEVEARIHPANGQVPISTPTILPVFHFFSQDSTYDQTSGLFISVGNLLFSDGYQIYTFSFISSWPLNESNVQLEILDLPTFASIQLDSWSKQALVLFTNDPINSWSIAWIPIQSIGNITSMKNTSISSTNVKNSWIPAPHYNNQLAKPKYFALYAVRLNQGGHALSISSIKSDNSSVQYFTVANSSTDFMTELRVARIYYDSEFPILALAGNFNSGPLLLLVNATILLSDFDVAASSTRSFFSSTTMFLGKPINPQQPSQNTLEVVYIGLVAGISVAAIVAVGILIYRKNVIKAKIRQRQTEIESQVELNNFNINPAISSHMDQEEIIRIHNNDLKRGVGDTAEISSPVLSPISIKNYSDSTTDSSKNMESGILNGATSTLYASGQRGLYVPGEYSADTRSYRPIKRIYLNQHCEVFLAQTLSEDLRKRSRNGLIAVKALKKVNAFFADAFYQEISILFFFVGKPNFVQLVGFCSSPYMILTDYYAMGDLERALLRRQSLIPTMRIALSFSIQISGALGLIHQSGFAHSDIKALNIFVDREKSGALQCYLGDFGLSQILDDSHLVVKAYRVLNAKGLTVAYAAPEILQRFRPSYQTKKTSDWMASDFKTADVYALGVLLYEILNCTAAWDWNAPGSSKE